MDLMEEFKNLKERYWKAQDYFKTKYELASQENKDAADKKFKVLNARLDEVWEVIRLHQIEMDSNDAANDDCKKLDQKIKELRAAGWKILKLECYRKSEKLIFKLEMNDFMKYAEVVED